MNSRLAKSAKILAVVFIAWMWFYAFVLAPRESANNIADERWSANSETICAEAQAARGKLADLKKIDPKNPAIVKEKARIIDLATDTIEQALDSIEKSPPTTEKGRALVPEWIRDYRAYIADRRAYSESLGSGTISEFTESVLDGIPISEKIGKFARENHMPSCQPPRDLQA